MISTSYVKPIAYVVEQKNIGSYERQYVHEVSYQKIIQQ